MDSPLPVGRPQDLGFSVQHTTALVGVLQAEVARQRLPGGVALIARHGQVLLHRAFGQQDLELKIPMALDSIFRIYSMTKPVASVAVLQLMERGKILLGDPVAKHLPEFADVPVAHLEAGQVMLRAPQRQPTVQDLLRHTAGLTYEILGNDPIQLQYALARLGQRELTNTAFSQALAKIPYRFEPGSVWEYSLADTGFVVPLGQHHQIAEPLKHDPDGGVPMRLLDPRKAAPMEAGGMGLMSTASDYALFLQCLLGGGSHSGVRILSPATVRLMTSDHLGSIAPNTVGRSGDLLPAGHGFGLGFAVRLQDGISSVSGSQGLYYWGGIAGTTFFVDPVKDFFAILMIQAPNQRDYYRPLFRNLVYAALCD